LHKLFAETIARDTTTDVMVPNVMGEIICVYVPKEKIILMYALS